LRVFLTDEILDEMLTAVSDKYPDFTADQGASLKVAMINAIPDCLLTEFAHAMDKAEISDPKDKHVLAAAIHGRVQVIVTDDQDFDTSSLDPHSIESQNPDDFLTDLFDLNEAAMKQIVGEEASARGETVDAVVDLLEQRGLIRFAQHLRR